MWLYLHRDWSRKFFSTNHLQPQILPINFHTDLLFFKTKMETLTLYSWNCVSSPPLRFMLSSPFPFAFCLCLVCYFHYKGARLTMQAQCQPPLLPDAPMAFGSMHMLSGHLNVCVLHSQKNNISPLASLIS
jgi:hypothetical protein